MQFDSLTFLCFFALVLAGYAALPGWRAQKAWLLGASYVFYAAWNPPFVLLLIATSSFDWWIARRLPATAPGAKRKRLLWLILLTHLGVLAYFKYSAFALENFAALLGTLGIAYQPPAMDIVLPVGISFYTFHSLSYCFDVYRERIRPTDSWLDYALYVAFFPQLVAGPIVRWTQMGHQFEAPRRISAQGLGLGFALLTLGLFEKVFLADGVFAPVANAAFGAEAVGAHDAWLGMLAFSGQIFCDFAGYSTCALGAAAALGFVLPTNFRNPYAAIGFSDFWRRWHISLSSWLRDYLYIALGGNRVAPLRRHANLMLTMLIGGLWHGAAWNFVAWGGLHGAYLVIEHALRQRLGLSRDPADYGLALKLGYGLITLLGVMYAWVWFRSGSFAQGWDFSRALVGLAPETTAHVQGFEGGLMLAAFAGLLLVHARWREREARDWLAQLPTLPLALLLSVMLILVVLSPGDGQAFIYFQF